MGAGVTSGSAAETWPRHAGAGILAAVEPVSDYATWEARLEAHDLEVRHQAVLRAYWREDQRRPSYRAKKSERLLWKRRHQRAA